MKVLTALLLVSAAWLQAGFEGFGIYCSLTSNRSLWSRLGTAWMTAPPMVYRETENGLARISPESSVGTSADTAETSLRALRQSHDPPEYLLMRLPDGTIERHWEAAERPVSMGSLLKPFLVLAYARTHDRFPVLTCHGATDRCWLPQGHGRQDIVGALAHSCNAYFRQIANGISPAALESVALTHGLATLRNEPNPESLIGIGDGWPNPPVAVLQAFRHLVEARSDPTVALVLKGMAQSASSGTAQEAGIRCFAKTGTAQCSHTPPNEGDGFAVLIYPTDQPRFILLTSMHGTTGARTAKYAGDILRKELRP